MSPEPIEFQIVQHLQAALLAMTVAGGYHYTMAASAVKLDPNSDIESLIAPNGPRPFSIIELGKQVREYQPSEQVRLVIPLVIHWVSDSSPTDDASRMQTFFRGVADVERAIAADVTRGGLAVDTRIVSPTFDTSSDGAQVWAQIDTEITIYRTYGVPDA